MSISRGDGLSSPKFSYGVVAGVVVARVERIRTVESLPVVARLGIESPGWMRSEDEEEKE